jgi:hypothetical protein
LTEVCKAVQYFRRRWVSAPGSHEITICVRHARAEIWGATQEHWSLRVTEIFSRSDGSSAVTQFSVVVCGATLLEVPNDITPAFTDIEVRPRIRAEVSFAVIIAAAKFSVFWFL